MNRGWKLFAGIALACLFITGAQSVAFSQGRGHGGGGGGGRGMGRSGAGDIGIGRPTGVGVDRGIGTSSSRSNGRADRGRDTASERSNGRFDAGIERARLQRENARHAEEELREHPHMAGRLHTTANDLRSGYQLALASNPDLKFGQYVAATRLAANLHSRYPNITREAILAGLADGRSIGQALHDLGVGDHEAKETRKRVEKEIKEARRD